MSVVKCDCGHEEWQEDVHSVYKVSEDKLFDLCEECFHEYDLVKNTIKPEQSEWMFLDDMNIL